MKDNSKFFKCSCHCCALQTTYFDDEPDIYFSIWEQGAKENHTLSFWQRLRWCWRVIRKGKPFEDQIILDNEQTIELYRELGNYLKWRAIKDGNIDWDEILNKTH